MTRSLVDRTVHSDIQFLLENQRELWIMGIWVCHKVIIKSKKKF